MHRILLCWEGGSGNGHIVRLGRIARALQQRGAHCSIAAYNTTVIGELKQYGFEVMQAPVDRWGPNKPLMLNSSLPPRDLCNFTISLQEMGFSQKKTIAVNLQGMGQDFRFGEARCGYR